MSESKSLNICPYIQRFRLRFADRSNLDLIIISTYCITITYKNERGKIFFWRAIGRDPIKFKSRRFYARPSSFRSVFYYPLVSNRLTVFVLVSINRTCGATTRRMGKGEHSGVYIGSSLRGQGIHPVSTHAGRQVPD